MSDLGIVDYAALGALSVSVLSLLVSGWSLIQNSRFNRRQNDFDETAERLNQILIEKENEDSTARLKADLGANFVNTGKHNWKLKVFNKGKGSATNVRLEILDDNGLLHTRDAADKFPQPIMEQHQHINVIASVHMSSPRRAHVKIIWDDETGTGHEKELTPVVS